MSKTAQYKETGSTTCRNCGIHSDWLFDKEGYVTCNLCIKKRMRNRSPLQRLTNNAKSAFRRKVIAPIATRLEMTKYRCKKLDREYNLTEEVLRELFIKQNNKCVLSGVPISPQDFSIDRIDSSKGYTTDNIQLVKLIFNQMKRNLTDAQFIEYCKIVASHHGSK